MLWLNINININHNHMLYMNNNGGVPFCPSPSRPGIIGPEAELTSQVLKEKKIKKNLIYAACL